MLKSPHRKKVPFFILWRSDQTGWNLHLPNIQIPLLFSNVIASDGVQMFEIWQALLLCQMLLQRGIPVDQADDVPWTLCLPASAMTRATNDPGAEPDSSFLRRAAGSRRHHSLPHPRGRESQLEGQEGGYSAAGLMVGRVWPVNFFGF